MNNEFITEDINILIKHINYICITRKLPYCVSVTCDLINHYKDEKIELRYHYLFHENNKEPTPIITSSITVSYDEYLDNKEVIIHSGSFHLYNDILTHTTFEQELNNKNDIYKWN